MGGGLWNRWSRTNRAYLLPVKGSRSSYFVRDREGVRRRINLEKAPAPLDPKFAQEDLHPGGYLTKTHAVPTESPFSLRTGNQITLDMLTVRYSPKGRLLATVRWSAPPIAASNSDSAFDPSGNLYALVYDWDRVHVVRFPLSQIDEGFVAIRLVPTLMIEGRRYTPLVACAEAAARKAVWNPKSKTAKVGSRTLAAGRNLRFVRGALWITRVGAEALGLNLTWHPKGYYAYVSRRKAA